MYIDLRVKDDYLTDMIEARSGKSPLDQKYNRNVFASTEFDKMNSIQWGFYMPPSMEGQRLQIAKVRKKFCSLDEVKDYLQDRIAQGTKSPRGIIICGEYQEVFEELRELAASADVLLLFEYEVLEQD